MTIWLLTSNTLFLRSVFTDPARQQWLMALIIMCLLDFELGFTNSFGPKIDGERDGKLKK